MFGSDATYWFVPAMFGALVILFAGYLLAKLLEKAVEKGLRKIRLNQLLVRGGVIQAVERSGTHAVALDLELDDELRRETLAREIVHAVQVARKGAGLRVEDQLFRETLAAPVAAQRMQAFLANGGQTRGVEIGELRLQEWF